MTTDHCTSSDIAVLIVAAGRGTRAGGTVPKQYQPLAGQPLLRRTILGLRAALPNAHIKVVIHPDDRPLFDAATAGLTIDAPVTGGATRQESVARGLRAVASDSQPPPGTILVHDAARPFADKALIEELLQALAAGAAACVPALPVTDTVKRRSEDGHLHTVDRERMFTVQTPQAFQLSPLLEAHEQAKGQTMTDDAAVMEAAGHTVVLTKGNRVNFKVTEPNDFDRAEQHILNGLADVRTGFGYDVHRFEAGDQVRLAGVSIPHSAALKGHSDADVGLHALTDAILAALCAGDIGTHFPPSDPKWRGAPSDIFLKDAAARVAARGGMIAHLGLTLICEAPKIGPHRLAMTGAITSITGVPAERISIQATTTEGLGAMGRGEGIAAQAIATIRLPLEAL